MYTRDPQEPGSPRHLLGGRLRSGPGYRRTRKRSEARTSDGESECRSRTNDAGEPSRGTLPRKGRHRSTELLEGTMTKTPGFATISPKVQQVAELAKEAPGMAFTTLAHHIDLDWLKEAYRRTRKDGATGVDGQTAEEYAANLEDNLRSLLERAKSGTYRAPPVRRAYI